MPHGDESRNEDPVPDDDQQPSVGASNLDPIPGLDAPASVGPQPGVQSDTANTIVGCLFIAGVIVGVGWLAHRFLGGWWGLAGLGGLVLAFSFPAALPRKVRGPVRSVLVVVALVGLGLAVAAPRIEADRRAGPLDALAPKLCQMFQPKSTAALTTEEAMIEKVTGGHDAGAADKIWARLINKHCPPPAPNQSPIAPAEQHFLVVARQTSQVLAKLPDDTLLKLGHAACTDLSNGSLAGAVTDAETAGFDDYSAGSLVGAAAATLCGAPTTSPDPAVTDMPSTDPAVGSEPTLTDTETPAPPPPTCADLRAVSATYAVRYGHDIDATYYWPRITVRNNSPLDISVTVGGTGKATFGLDPSTAPNADWGLEDNGHDVPAHKSSRFDPDASGVYGDATLTVYPGDHITKFTVTATMTAGDDGLGGATLSCALRVARG